MKHAISLFAVFGCLICGCSRGEFEASKAGELRFNHTTVSNGTPIRYEWIIPAADMQSILGKIVAQDPKYDGVLASGTQTATMSYEDGEISIRWSRVKMAETVVLLTIRGNHYMLTEPHASEFYRLLAKHKKRSSQQSTGE